MHLHSITKRAGAALFLFFLVKGLVWLALLGAGAAGLAAI